MRTLLAIQQTSRELFLESDELFCFIFQIGLLQEPFCKDYQPVSTSLQMPKIYSVGTNKLSNFYGSIKATENHEDDRSLTLYFRWALSTSIPTCIHSQKSVFIFSFLKIGHVLNQVPPSHNCKTMHMTNEILSNYKKIAPHREIARIDWVFQVCLT